MENDTLESKMPQDFYRKKDTINQSDQEENKREDYPLQGRRYVRGIDLAEYIGKEIPEWIVNEVLSDLDGE